MKDEIEARLEGFGMDFGIEPWRPINPRQLGALLEEEVRAMHGVLARLRQELRALQTPATTRQWVKEMHRQQQLDDADPFGAPF